MWRVKHESAGGERAASAPVPDHSARLTRLCCPVCERVLAWPLWTWQKSSAQIKLYVHWDIFYVGFVLSSSWESYVKSQHRVGGCFFSFWPAGIPNTGTLLPCQDKFHLLLLFSHATSCANQPFNSPSNPAINALLKLFFFFFPRLISSPVLYPTLCRL